MSEQESYRDSTGGGDAGAARLADSLLFGAPRPPEAPGRRGGSWVRVFVSIFVAYHASVLVVHNLPRSGLTRPFLYRFETRLKTAAYLAASGSGQTWGMFAPNPTQENVFIRVWVEDAEGKLHDAEHDIHGRREHPYLLYEHMGKVNQRLDEAVRYRRSYAAWVCREWERDHGGRPARAVRLERLSTSVPSPSEVADRGGFDPRALPLKRRELETFPCASTAWAQLPPRLRERYGFAPAAPGTFKPGVVRTWTDRRRRIEGAAREDEAP
jgi:hypothetical protein